MVQYAKNTTILLPNGGTVGEFMKPKIEQAYLTGTMPKMLPMLEG